MDDRIQRSWLYAPAHDERLLARVLTAAADAVVLDLEDAVPVPAKASARHTLRAWLAEVPADSPEVWVRVNPGAEQVVDLAALLDRPSVTGILAAKSDSAADLRRTRTLMDDAGLREVALMPLVESATAVVNVADFAGIRGVQSVHLGEADLGADLGITVSEGEIELLPARGAVVLGSRAAGLRSPVGPVSGELRDVDAILRTTLALKRLGFVGRACIHPRQVEIVNEVYTPTTAEVGAAQGLVTEATLRAEGGAGAFVDSTGRFVDAAVVRAAQLTLALHNASSNRKG